MRVTFTFLLVVPFLLLISCQHKKKLITRQPPPKVFDTSYEKWSEDSFDVNYIHVHGKDTAIAPAVAEG